jgi:hypothetical protein
MAVVPDCMRRYSSWLLYFAISYTCCGASDFMNLNSFSKLVMDVIGIGLLALFLYFSLAFRASPISFMDPGFPIISESDWNLAPPDILSWPQYPERFVSEDEFSEAAYSSQFNLDDYSQMFPNPFTPTRIEPTDFVGFQTVIRYSERDHAQSAFQDAYAEYVDKLTYQNLITEIPGLNFSSKADMYDIWCDQISADRKTTFDPEDVGTCYYWAVHGRYFSRIRFSLSSVHGLGRQFSVEMFNDILNRAEHKLANAPK